METFTQWFKRRGWKSYTLPIIIAIAVNYGIFFTDGATSMFQDPEIPIIIWVMAFIAYFGFHVGMTWHIITAFKAQRNK